VRSTTRDPGLPSFDALVVGAGPGGAAAAIALAEGGARVLVVERDRVPRVKICGGGVLARALETVPRSAIAPPDRSVREVEVRLPDLGRGFRVERDEPLVHLTMRDRFDAGLVEAAERAGAVVWTDCRFETLETAPDGAVVHTTRGSVRTRHVVAADGALGPVARAAGWPGPVRGAAALEWEVAADPETIERFASCVRFDIGRPAHGYAWVFPKRRHLSIGVLTMRRERAHLPRLLSEYVRDLGIEPRNGTRPCGFPIPCFGRAGGAARGAVLLTGDAAGLADPITAEGISPAMRSGRLAAAAILAHAEDARAVAEAYTRSLEHELAREARAARRVAALLYGAPRLRRAMFAAAGREVCEALTEVIRGRRSYRALTYGASSYGKLLLRLAWGSLSAWRSGSFTSSRS
jgi:geranylgeranyl reductase family protein